MGGCGCSIQQGWFTILLTLCGGDGFVRVCVQVRYLKVIEKSGYQALPWVRYITTAGNYEIRMN